MAVTVVTRHKEAHTSAAAGVCSGGMGSGMGIANSLESGLGSLQLRERLLQPENAGGARLATVQKLLYTPWDCTT